MTRRSFWQEKLGGNVARDEKQIAALEALGWKTYVIWECQVKNAGVLDKIFQGLRGRSVLPN